MHIYTHIDFMCLYGFIYTTYACAVSTVCLTPAYTCICVCPNKQLRENSKRPIIPSLTNSLQQKHRLL